MRSLSNTPIEKALPTTTTATLSIASPTTPKDEVHKSPTRSESPTTLGRSGTLSWQQRRRPLSHIALENNRLQQQTSPGSRPSSPEKEHSRADIAQSLASKDPSWFKQTADRGLGSAALRRTPEPDTVPTEVFKMPGMELRSKGEALASPTTDIHRSNSPSRAGSFRESELWSNRHSAATSVSEVGLPSLRSSSAYDDAPVLTAPKEEGHTTIGSGRSSPTKGMGGFVQSAMMKRSDSVTKRWSATATPGLQRAGSTASNRGGLAGRGESTSPGWASTTSKTDNRQSGLAKVQSLEPSSRPSSIYSNYTITQNTDEDRDAASRLNSIQTTSASLHSRSKSVASLLSKTDAEDTKSGFQSPPASPSKRWSPTKSTWLESKLSQPEEKAKSTPAPPAQPSWMTDLAKAKQQRTSVTIEKSLDLPPNPPAIEAETSQPPTSFPKPLTLTKSAPAIPPSTEKQGMNSTTRPLPLRKTSASSAPKVAPKPAVKSAEVGKLDFRANLKSRAPAPPKQTETPEFQNAFGKLRKTQPERFVAPDELKNNILRGKAGLAQTGGPAKRERVDELKESLLKKKEEMKVKAATEPQQPEKPKDSIKPEALVMRQKMNKVEFPKPSNELDRATKPSMSTTAILPVKEAADSNHLPISRDNLSASAQPATNLKGPIETSQPAPSASRQPATGGKLANKINPALASILSRGPPGLGSSPGSKPVVPVASASESPKESPELTHMTKGRARGPKRRAPKMNDSGKRSSDETNSMTTSHSPSERDQASAAVQPESMNIVERVAQTKPAPIAPKPKVELPTKVKVKVNVTPRSAPELEGTMESQILPSNNEAEVLPVERLSEPPVEPADAITTSTSDRHHKDDRPVTPTQPIFPRPISGLSMKERSQETLPATPGRLDVAKLGAFNLGLDAKNLEADTVVVKSEPSKTGFEKPEKLKRQSTKIMHLDLRTPLSSQPGSPTRSPTRSPGHVSVRDAVAKEIITPISAPLDFGKSESQTASPVRSPIKVSVRDVASKWSTNGTSSNTSARVKSPIKLPKQEDEDKAMVEAGLKPSTAESDVHSKKPANGLGLANISSKEPSSAREQQSQSSDPFSSAAENIIATTPTFRISPAKASRPNSTQIEPAPSSPIKRSRPPSMTIRVPPPDSPGSPIPHTSDAARMFSEVFDDQPRISGSTTVDVLTVIENYPLSTDKIETVRSQMREIDENGNLISLPSGREHVLFEESMYVCVHEFSTAKAGHTTEVYFWSGNDAAVADALLIARNIAKANTGKLITVKQGKEPPAFFQALGGIVITFRGSKIEKRDSTGLPDRFILCGRKHLGHVAFDEVDFARASFCSGFPFLVSDNKKIYLWRGAGSSAEELGCARLIAMDIGLSPNIEEIAEGEEPASFLSLFPANSGSMARSPGIPPSATHWRLKASLGDKYRTRLFRVTQEAVLPPRKNSAFQVSNFFVGWASTAASLLPPSLSPSTPTFSSPSSVSTFQSPFTESSEKKALSLLGTNTNPGTPKSPGPQSEVACNVDEIVPFCREDLLGEGVWVLDAFFEVYM